MLEWSSRSPHGERGLKSDAADDAVEHAQSLSSWRAWIEIGPSGVYGPWRPGRSPHGERGLKFEHAEHDVGGRVALLMESVD